MEDRITVFGMETTWSEVNRVADLVTRGAVTYLDMVEANHAHSMTRMAEDAGTQLIDDPIAPTAETLTYRVKHPKKGPSDANRTSPYEILHRAREETGLNTEQLADRLGTSTDRLLLYDAGAAIVPMKGRGRYRRLEKELDESIRMEAIDSDLL